MEGLDSDEEGVEAFWDGAAACFSWLIPFFLDSEG